VPETIEWLSDNGSSYIAHETKRFARDVGLEPRTTPVKSPQLNGMTEAFVRTIKCDYARVSRLPNARAILKLLSKWFEHYNTIHSHRALSQCSHHEFITDCKTQ
jgi:putative transposase